jgi:LPXTG-site transpeptidase (sortase) family protein
MLRRGIHVWRRDLGSALLVVGAIFLALSVGTVAYAQWVEWQHQLQQPAGPLETLPERLEIQVAESPHLSEATGSSSPSSPPPPEPVGSEGPGTHSANEGSPVPAPPTPTAQATTVPTSTPVPTADDVWRTTLPRLEVAWESDWPHAIALLEAFHAQFPDHTAAREKLYAALVSYGQALIASGLVMEGTAQLERAQELLPGRGEANAAFLALTPTPTPIPSPVLQPSYGPPVWISIPRIGVNSSVVQVGARGGEYQVPSFDVGHHADSANPGEPGNAVFNGHLETIDAGRVFARLKQLTVGDAVYVYTRSHRLDWVVKGVRTVPNSDHSFIRLAADTQITLYTCAGRYNPLTRGYSHWLVVVGWLVQSTPRT